MAAGGNQIHNNEKSDWSKFNQLFFFYFFFLFLIKTKQNKHQHLLCLCIEIPSTNANLVMFFSSFQEPTTQPPPTTRGVRVHMTNPCIQNQTLCDKFCGEGYLLGPDGCQYCLCRNLIPGLVYTKGKYKMMIKRDTDPSLEMLRDVIRSWGH